MDTDSSLLVSLMHINCFSKKKEGKNSLPESLHILQSHLRVCVSFGYSCNVYDVIELSKLKGKK